MDMAAECRIEPWLQLVRAPNPSAMTGQGTNTWILGHDRLAIIDPGPDLPDHLAGLREVIAGREVEAILVTHAHLDHSALAPALARQTGAPVMAFGPADAGLSSLMQSLAAAGLAGGGEGTDRDFVPDLTLQDGREVRLADLSIKVIHTPGHMAGHLCFAVGDTLFSGDHVMGWSTSLVSPPEGDMGAYVASLRRLMGQGWRVFYPGHGIPVMTPQERLVELIEHRAMREASILAALAQAPATPEDLATLIYTATPPHLLGAARRNVFAHLIDLYERGVVVADPNLTASARYSTT